METCKYNVRFKAALSDGSNILEGRGDYDTPKAWQKLQEHIKEHNLTITALGLYTKKGQNFNLPSNGRLVADYFLDQMSSKGVVMKVAKLIDSKRQERRFELVQGEISALLKKEVAEDTTGIIFYDTEGKSYYLPRINVNPKFARFNDERVLSFNLYRRGAQDLDLDGNSIGQQEVYTVAEAIMPSKKVEIWVSENNPSNCWVI